MEKNKVDWHTEENWKEWWKIMEKEGRLKGINNWDELMKKMEELKIDE